MVRVAIAFSCRAEVKDKLERLLLRRSVEVCLDERALIVLAWLHGRPNDEVTREISVWPNTVGQWRRRFAAFSIAGLQDEPRSGKLSKYDVAFRDRILAQLELPPPTGMASWRLLWFSTFLRKTLNNTSFKSIKQLTKAIHDFIAAYKANAAPFICANGKSKDRSFKTLSLTYAI